jgi:structural maintenance of chromosome 1
MDVDGEDLSQRAPKISDYGIHPSFEDLDEDLTDEWSEDTENMLSEKITAIQSDLDKMAPNMRSADRLEQTSEKLQAVDREFNDSRKSYKKAQQEFQKVQQRRMELFNKAFNHIKDQIAPVYKDLTKSSSWPLGGQAYLDVEEEDEPYLSGVKYHATPPGKRFRDMEHLSGGEKTMAALALLFAIHTYAPSPFFVLDEVDAALDVANTMRLANYVREKAGPGMQFVVISLKAGLFQESETLVGVMRDQGVNSSRALTLDVSDFPDLGSCRDVFADYRLTVAQISGCVSFDTECGIMARLKQSSSCFRICKDSLGTWKESFGRKVLDGGWIRLRKGRRCRSCNVYIIQPWSPLFQPSPQSIKQQQSTALPVDRL